jgi:hypothetical protein
VRCLILHALAFSCARKISSQSARATRTPSRTASRSNVGQEGFDALVHRVSPPYRLSA